MSVAAPSLSSGGHRITAPLLVLSDTVAAALLFADLLVVCVSVLLRFLFNAPVEWADDVARGLMVGSSFFGAASALARAENLGGAGRAQRGLCSTDRPYNRRRLPGKRTNAAGVKKMLAA